MRFARNVISGGLVAAAALAFVRPAAAQSYTWTGGSAPPNGNWTTASNWSSLPVGGTTTTLTFGSAPVTTLNNNFAGTFTLNSMTFSAGAPAYAISGNTLNLVAISGTQGAGISSNSSNTVTVNNSITASDLTVGGSGIGTLLLTGGITTTATSGGYGTVDSNGLVTLRGTSTVANGLYPDRGTLTINGGGSVTSGFGYIGYFGSFPGFNQSSVVVGGTGTGNWTNTSNLIVGYSTGADTLTVTGGGTVSNTSGTIGNTAGGSGTVHVGGGTGASSWTNSGELDVGFYGTGTLTITGGGTVSSAKSVVGFYSGSQGTVNVGGGSGTSTWNINGVFQVGIFGTGTLTITGGGTVSSGYSEVRGSATIGGGAGTSSWTSSSDINVLSQGTVTITGGGTVSDVNGIIGADTGTASVSVLIGGGTGTSAWNNSNLLGVGYGGDGTLTITGGGTVSTFVGHIGHTGNSGPAPNGSVAIGGGTGTSVLTCSGTLNVGYDSLGVLTVTGGGAVYSATSNIGVNTGGQGTVNVGGGTGTSSWATGGTLYVGKSGTGTLTIGTGGLVEAGALAGNAGGHVNLTGGTLQITGTAVMTANPGFTIGTGGGTIEVTNAVAPGRLLLGGSIDGSGTLTKTGAGWLALAGANTLSGQINLQQGRLGNDYLTASWNGGGGTFPGVAVSSGAELDLRGQDVRLSSLTGNGTVINSYGNGLTNTLYLGNNNLSYTFAGVIAGNGTGSSGEGNGRTNLTKIGTGTLTLTGNNTYSGTTTIGGGTVLVNNTSGSGTGTGPVTVQTGGMLGGGGTTVGATWPPD
jgi:T5SS/PEP-CTERM-associated repeat protein